MFLRNLLILPLLFLLCGCVPSPHPLSPPFSRNPSISEKIVALTFDDGPHPIHTPRLLDYLKKERVKATFFLIGRNVESFPEIVKRIIEEGHEIGSHTYKHPNLDQLNFSQAYEEVYQGIQAIEKVTGKAPILFRPPYGALSHNKRQKFQKEGLSLIFWSLDLLDWKDRDAKIISQKIISQIQRGDIILAHDIHPTTVDAFPEILSSLKEKGWKFVSVSHLMKLKN